MNPLKLNSRVGFGTASLHHVGSQARQLNLLHSAYDAGIRYFDTAPLYGHGVAEKVTGKLIAHYRSQGGVTVATKVGLMPNQLVGQFSALLFPYIAVRSLTTKIGLVSSTFWQPQRNYSAHYLVSRVENSLKSMSCDFLDVVLLHEPMLVELQACEELIHAAQKLKQRGLVKSFGVSASLEVGQWVFENVPEFAEVLQIEVSNQITEIDCAWIAEHAHATFGHFRTAPRIADESDRLQYVVQNAIQCNPQGTILFSSTKANHIRSFVSAVTLADQKTRG